VRAALEAEPVTAALFARLEQVDPVAATKMLPTNRRRIVRALEVTEGSGRPFSTYGPGLDAYGPTPFRLLGLWPGRMALAERLDARFRAMIDGGFLDEVRALAARPAGVSRTARQALGYSQVFAHVEGGRPLDHCIDEAVRATIRFARRQRVWFRRDPRIAWINADIDGAVVAGGQHW
jgi:tRNA dimethylallyltransferase